MSIRKFASTPLNLSFLGKSSLILILWLLFSNAAQAAFNLRIAINKSTSQITIGSSTPATLRDNSGQVVGQIHGGSAYQVVSRQNQVVVGNAQARQLWVEPQGEGFVWIGDRWYRGDVQLVAQGSRLSAINHVDLEDYLYSVVGAEAIASWPLEALKAQAVAARSYALHERSQSRSSLYDLDTTTFTQVYKGLASEASSTHQAVQATTGEVIVYNRQAILAAFHSSSGGHTENAEDVWTSPLPYLRGVVDYDRQAPVYQWSKSYTAKELSRLIGGVGTIQSCIPERTTPHGRIITMRIVGSGGTTRLSGAQIRSALGLRSRLFTITPSGNGFIVQGRGFGHGVGMSQWGAQSLASRGWDYRQILGHYYRNAALSRMGS
ncbi:MAG: SpoIID/LytB domain-containing protein [Jaaginema sp. PMC 1079.18]|nr:SpoIID/LytB domain-containing protein [Jaaginema sp. PMC 1080.18]MEC4851035.1 SpoIID/LytB domain-containing protein [Jaaginema sp. PMC 1079.18]MEC4865837.1 SpoIID/LytB domain-containing protein [Jaaginema sp. PMC 1078.18]